MKEAPQRFTLVDEVGQKKVKPAIDPVIKQRRARLFWVIAAIIAFFMLTNWMGIIQTGHFERDQTQQMQELSDEVKEFRTQWHETFGWELPTLTP